jgi:hypothetical protein
MTERDFFFSLVPLGGNFIRFFPLISSQSSLSLDVENERKSERDAGARDGDDAISVRALLFFVFLERESERELKREKFLFFLPSRGFVQRKLLFFLWSNETRKSSLTDIFYMNIIQLN